MSVTCRPPWMKWYFPDAELVGDVGPSLKLLADRIEGELPNAGVLLPLREGILHTSPSVRRSAASH